MALNLNRRKMLRRSQKGLMFTLLTIILFVLMLAEVITYVVINNTYNQQASEAAAVVGADSLATTLKGALSQFLVSGMGRAIEVYVPAGSTLQYPLNSTEAGALSSLVYNGVAEGTYYTGMGNATILNFTSAMEKQASAQNSNMVISNSSITVYQDSPEYINISYTGMATINTTYGFFTYPLSTDVGYPTMLSYVNITLQNAQSASTPAPFQQMITFNPTAYGSYEGADLGNIRFYQGTTELYSWCESGCSSSSTSATFWVSLPGGIPADSNTTITMGFLPKNVEYSMAYRSSIAVAHAGEAPQLSPTYAEYDNGANVFSFYDDFAGTTINSEYTQVIPSGTTITQNNGITISTDSSVTYGGLILTNGFSNSPVQIFGGDVTAVSGVAVGLMIQNGNTDTSEGYGFNYWGGSVAYGTMYSPGFSSGDIPNLQISTGIMEGALPSSSSQIWYKNYVSTSGSSTLLTLTSTLYPSIGIYYSSASTSITYQWIRLRDYPPNGVMPSASFSSVVRTT